MNKQNFYTICEKALNAISVQLHSDPGMPNMNLENYLNCLAQQNNFRYRRIRLTEQWWKYDTGPIIALQKTTQQYVTLLPCSTGGYNLYKDNAKPIKLAPELANTLEDQAYVFYRCLPEHLIRWRDLLGFAFTGIRPDLFRLFIVFVIVSTLGLITPVAMGILFDNVVPNADYHLLTQFIIALTVNVFIITLFSFTRFIAVLRIRFKITASLQAAIWDRLLRLPLTFFRQFTAGDLSARSNAINAIEQQLTGAVVTNILSGIFSIFALGLMYYYDSLLATVAVGLVLLIAGISIWGSWLQLKYLRQVLYHHGKLTGLVLQLLTSISKLRVAAKEKESYALWEKRLNQKIKASFDAGKVAINMGVFSTVFGVVVTIILFMLVVQRGEQLTFGAFISFNAAFAQFFAAIFAMVGTVTGIMRIIPLYERAKPILNAQIELAGKGKQISALTGKIAIGKVNFHYYEKSEAVLHKISLTINPGEFVAIVGPSGSGKSTLLKLLLGLETPSSGEILYDNHNLTDLNILKIRQQFGVVLQSTNLLPGTILENIIGGHRDATIQDAWEVANWVVIAKDIQAMPMGMYTPVIENGRTLSVGQRQRILLARALIRKPRILLLDEATSALDNLTQMQIQQSLQQLNITRIVVAHRLSTIQNADRIYVLSQGKIVESGSYKQLLANNHLFTQLASRQL